MTVTMPTAAQKHAETQVPIHDLLHRRWSPRAFADQPVEREVLVSLFEAARWAPSGGNGQPWSFIVAERERDPEGFAQALALLNERNQLWAQHAPVLLFGITRRIRADGKEHRHAHYDLGLAVENLVIQGMELGVMVHQMAGFDVERTQAFYAIPPEHEAVIAIALGYPGSPEALPDDLREREAAQRQRQPLGQFVFGGRFGETAAFIGE